MTFHLDDLLRDDKRDGNLIPDLSKATCNSPEEFRILMESCLEMKIKPEKVKKDDVKIRDKDFSWKVTRREVKLRERQWNYGNPISPDMRSLNLHEFQQISIDWRMLTSLRPKLNQDEEMFSRLVEIGKLERKTALRERRAFVSFIRLKKNRAGICETSVKMCPECGDEFCDSSLCVDITYDSFTRVALVTTQTKASLSADTTVIIAKISGGSNKAKRRKSKGKMNKFARIFRKGKRKAKDKKTKSTKKTK